MIIDDGRLDSFMRRIRKVHFIGIGGAGMSGIAEVMNTLNYEVSGSDLTSNAATKRLRDAGVKIYQNHNADNIKGVDVVVTSTAIQSDNVEVTAARKMRMPIVPRAEKLVSGSSGSKTSVPVTSVRRWNHG